MSMRKLGRRQLLRALGGAGIGLPLLSSLGSGGARAQAVAAPKRLILMYTPNGVIHEGWWPTPGAADTEFTLNQIHQSLAPYQDRLILLKGVNNLVASTGLTGGPHQRGIGGLYTAQTLGQGTFVDGCGKTAGWANGISVDQEIAAVIGQSTALKSLELGVRALENDVQGRISYSGAGQPLPPMNQPLDVYNRLIMAPGFSVAPSDPLLAQRKSVLDAVGRQFDMLAAEVSTEDREKLESHHELLRDIERRMSAGTNGCTVVDQPPLLDPASETDMPLIAELEVDLLAMALACDLTRVASLQISTSLNRIRYPWVNSMGEGHALSHSFGSDADAAAQLVERGKWHCGLIARLCDRLSTIAEGDGSALDNTLLVYCSEISLGNSHSHTDMPFLLVGGGWHFRTGRYLELGGVSHSNLLVSLMNAMGLPAQTFGLPEHCTGPMVGLV
jgi:hypothetical protein